MTWRQGGHWRRVEECMCGGTIRVTDRNDDVEVVAAIQEHQRTPRHMAYSRGDKYLPVYEEAVAA